MVKKYYDDPAGCDRNGEELWRYVSRKNGDDKNSKLSIENMIKAVNEENFKLIVASTDGLAGRLKTLASALRIDPNPKVFWWLKSALKEHKFTDLFKNGEMEVPILPPDFDFILYSDGFLLILPEDELPIDFTDKKLYQRRNGFYNTDTRQRIDWEFDRIPTYLKEEYSKMFSIIKSQVRNDILLEVDNFSNNFTDKTISVHIRSGTGHPIEGIVQEERRAFKLDETIKVMESYSDDYTFYVSTDEYVEQGSNNILSTLQEKFGDRIFYHKKDSLSVRGALIDLLLLSKNKTIIGTYFSSFTEVSWWFGGATAKVIFPGWK